MTDQAPFAPPSGALPPRVPEAAPVPPPALPPPPSVRPVLPAPWGPAIAAPPPRRRPRWLVPVIAGATVLVLGLGALLVGGALWFAGVLRDIPTVDPVPGGPEATQRTPTPIDESGFRGPPGSPVAVEPLECEGCFTVDDAGRLALPEGAYARLGVPESDDARLEATAGDDHADTVSAWLDGEGRPDRCFFTQSTAPIPVALARDPADRRDDPVLYREWHSDADEYYWLTETARVFDDSATATAHLRALDAAIDTCGVFVLADAGWQASVAPAPALDLPASVAAYGWVESFDTWRYYAIDVQRGNLVVRITLGTDGDGPVPGDFRAFVEDYAVALAALDPDESGLPLAAPDPAPAASE